MYATSMDRRDAASVVRILAGGSPEFVGVLRRIHGSVVFSREQQPGVA
ncbi:hypothetical protein ACQP2Y_21065 [Actinoplanes sp. CA-051413]